MGGCPRKLLCLRDLFMCFVGGKRRLPIFLRCVFVAIYARAAKIVRRLAIVQTCTALVRVIEVAADTTSFYRIRNLPVHLAEIPDHHPRLLGCQLWPSDSGHFDPFRHFALQEVVKFLRQFQVSFVVGAHFAPPISSGRAGVMICLRKSNSVFYRRPSVAPACVWPGWVRVGFQVDRSWVGFRLITIRRL